MAEAMVVEDRAAESKRFFCHMCNVEINIPNSDFTCPLCANGFVEELPANAPDMASPAPGASSGVRSGSSGSGSSGSHDTLSRGSSSGGSQVNVESLRNDIVSLLNMRNVSNLEITIEPNRRHSNVLHLGGFGGPSGSGSGGGLTAGGRVRPANLDRLDNVLFDFLQSLPLAGATAEIVTGPGGGGVGGGGNSHMFFMGNPGDYAWGREGLDTIVTQMLNQMETSGPPPLSAQRINEIPNVQISAEEVDRKIQCSICWDDFKIDETVRKLPCSHLYHENCIVPWLNLHSTCPICRKSLADEGSDADDEFVMLDEFGPELGADGSNSARSSASTATGTDNPSSANNSSSIASQTTAESGRGRPEPTNPAQPARNNVFTFDDDNMFLD
ncbi:E3 ubiquitin-protein ligase Iruka [Drosophila rhopaloa]|uniref:RING-type E3 ubiquitin transferase n=1 Tax=Drosophila rhopaloa TaxID=1041015 RepID=A0A6P4F8Z5_DRORH|nr:E3 ubiquitin-protein ligase Iruka [Drosophila rhopaloa]